MSIVIVTKRCFLICEDVTHITVQEHSVEDDDRTWIVRKLSPRENNGTYNIQMQYYATPDPSNLGYRETQMLNIIIKGREEAYRTFAEIVREVRDQKPDAKYLDELVEKMLNGTVEGTIR